MPTPYAEMDSWNSEQVALFKEKAKSLDRNAFITTALGKAAARTVVAEGDSWFDYPVGTDVIDCLRHHHGYTIENYARMGDTLENMIYGCGINKRFERINPTINQVLRKITELKPKVFLFSGGGNDVAGDKFESYLNHGDSGLPTLREEFASQIIGVIFRKYFEDLIKKVAAASPDTHIVTHGYGHTLPTGIGVDVLFVTFAGPWLRPALAKKGITDTAEQHAAVNRLIDKYNDMLADLSRQHSRFHLVDLRGMLDAKKDWSNELHLHNSAYARVAQKIHDTIAQLP